MSLDDLCPIIASAHLHKWKVVMMQVRMRWDRGELNLVKQREVETRLTNFSSACVAQSIASCCMSSDISAFLITAFLSVIFRQTLQTPPNNTANTEQHQRSRTALRRTGTGQRPSKRLRQQHLTRRPISAAVARQLIAASHSGIQQCECLHLISRFLLQCFWRVIQTRTG